MDWFRLLRETTSWKLMPLYGCTCLRGELVFRGDRKLEAYVTLRSRLRIVVKRGADASGGALRGGC